jgi:peptidoglycan/LPS O-acetylase OafA/YrhL
MSGSSRIPSLDGLRTIAVMIVFLSHATLANFFPARFGVTVFFFLSGYIITTLMRAEFEGSGTVSFKRFYLRRIYRIFPPLYLVMALAAVLTWAGYLKNTVTWPGVTAQLLNMTNYYALYGSSFEFLRGTRVLWSLAVEEHFYLFFPLLFLGLAKRMSYEKLAVVLAVLCAVVLLWRCYLYYGLGVDTNWAFIATDTRIDSILYGCILAIWFNPAVDKPLLTSRAAEIGVLIIAVAALIFSVSYQKPEFELTLMFTLQGLALFPVVAFAIRYPDWPVFRWLNWKPIVGLGLISYTFYLCHVIALLLTAQMTDNFWLSKSLAFLLAVAFSVAMYRIVEMPLAKKRAALHRTANSAQQKPDREQPVRDIA